MLETLARNWWIFAVRGIAAIIFGVLAFAWPGITLVVLVALFAAYAIVDGVMGLVALVRGDPEARRHAWAVGIMGVLGIVAGIAAFVWPGVTAVALLYIVAFWAIAIGVMQIIAAIRLRKEIKGELWMGIGGALLILWGIFLIAFPGLACCRWSGWWRSCRSRSGPRASSSHGSGERGTPCRPEPLDGGCP